MLAIRHTNTSTSKNLGTLIGLLNDPNCVEVRLFATHSSPLEHFADSDGPECNLPLVSAIARYVIPNISEVYVLFDGAFLTASRRPRFLEVRELMDVAEASGKALYCSQPVPFTSSLDRESAVTLLKELEPVKTFNAETRAGYFELLCGIPESKYP